MVTTADEEHDARVRLLRSHAMTSTTWDRHRGHDPAYDIVDIGFNFRLDEPRAALGLSRLGRLRASLDSRRATVRAYRERLVASPGSSCASTMRRSARITLRLPDPAARPLQPRQLPGRPQSCRHSDDLVSGTAHVHRVQPIRPRHRTGQRGRGRRPPLCSSAEPTMSIEEVDLVVEAAKAALSVAL